MVGVRRLHRYTYLDYISVDSDSSEEYDTTTKLDCYRQISSLREYVIVSHRERRIVVHRRVDGNDWTSQVAISGGRVSVPSIGAELVVDTVYRKSAIR